MRPKSTLSLLFLSFASSLANSQTGDPYPSWLQNSEIELRALVQHQIGVIRTNGPKSLGAVLDTTPVRVASLPLPSPVTAFTAGGGNEIILPPEFLLLAKFVGDAAVIGYSAPEFSNCAIGYMGAIQKRLSENGNRAANGKSPFRLLAPEEYAANVGQQCANFAKKFPITTVQRQVRDQGVRSVVFFALLHEMGHVALRHQIIAVDKVHGLSSDALKLDALLLAMRSSRVQEGTADIWAVDTLAALGGGYSDVVNIVFVNYFLASTGLDCFYESGDSHPNGVRRYARILSRFKLASEAVAGKPWPNDVGSIAHDMRVFSEKAATLLGCPSR